jgi:hypothetical protein
MEISPYSKIEVSRDNQKGIFLRVNSKLYLHHLNSQFHSPQYSFHPYVSQSSELFVPPKPPDVTWEDHFMNFLSDIIELVKEAEEDELRQMQRLSQAQNLLSQFNKNLETEQ